VAKNSVWLETSLHFSNYKLSIGNSGMGIPKIIFDSASERTKRMKTQHLNTSSSIYNELCHVAYMSLHASGSRKTSIILKRAIIVCESALEFSMSMPHAWICFFKCLFHIAYKLPLKTRQIMA